MSHVITIKPTATATEKKQLATIKASIDKLGLASVETAVLVSEAIINKSYVNLFETRSDFVEYLGIANSTVTNYVSAYRFYVDVRKVSDIHAYKDIKAVCSIDTAVRLYRLHKSDKLTDFVGFCEKKYKALPTAMSQNKLKEAIKAFSTVDGKATDDTVTRICAQLDKCSLEQLEAIKAHLDKLVTATVATKAEKAPKKRTAKTA